MVAPSRHPPLSPAASRAGTTGRSPDRPRAGRASRRGLAVQAAQPNDPSLLLVAVRLELADIGPQVAGLLLVLDAGEEHLGAGDLGARILDVVLEGRLAPGDARILVGVAVIVARGRSRLAAVEAVELGADPVLGALADLVAGHALLENGFAGFRVLRPARAHRRDQGGRRRNYHNNLHVDLLELPQERAP